MRRSLTNLILAAIALSGAAQAKDAGSGSPRVVNLTITPARVDAGQPAPTLLPKPEERTDGDGAAFYYKAAEALPADLDRSQLAQWNRGPLNQLPLDPAQAVLQRAQASLELVSQGNRCKSCDWPPFVPGTLPPNLTEFRHVAELLHLKARVELRQSQYDKAAETLRTGLAMAKHIGEAPTSSQGMVGVAMAALLLRLVEDWAQTAGAPNLYPALHALPRPLIDLNVPMSSELKNLETSTQYNRLVRAALRRQLEGSFVAVRRLMNRLDGNVAALECVEGLRHFAAGHDGRLPAQLSEITGVQLPNDPATQRPFVYRADGPKATLEVAAPEGGTPRDALRYEITVAH
jgi:hypothetical protein